MSVALAAPAAAGAEGGEAPEQEQHGEHPRHVAALCHRPASGAPVGRSPRGQSAEPGTRLVASLEAVRVAVDQPPLPVLEAEHVRHAVRPFGRPVGAGEPDAGALDVGGDRQARRGHCREVLVADRPAAPELLGRPVPAPAHLGPPLLVAAPAEEGRDVVPVRVERLDRAGVARHERVHRGLEPLDRAAPAVSITLLGHPRPPDGRIGIRAGPAGVTDPSRARRPPGPATRPRPGARSCRAAPRGCSS